MATDDLLIALFWDSQEWADAKEKESFKKKFGLFNALLKFLRAREGVPEEGPSEERIKTANRMEITIRSRWRKKGAQKRKRKKKFKEKLAASERKKAEQLQEAPSLPMELHVHKMPWQKTESGKRRLRKATR